MCMRKREETENDAKTEAEREAVTRHTDRQTDRHAEDQRPINESGEREGEG